MALTAEQRTAIDCDDRDILLQAGAGSGKTSTTVNRYERLLTGVRTDGRTSEVLEPSAILVFTFTDKAAGELRERIRRLRKSGGREFSMGSIWVGTFHSICARILRAHPVAAGVDPAFDVIDDVVAARLKESAYEAGLEQTCEVEGAIEHHLVRPGRAIGREAVVAGFALRSGGELGENHPSRVNYPGR